MFSQSNVNDRFATWYKGKRPTAVETDQINKIFGYNFPQDNFNRFHTWHIQPMSKSRKKKGWKYIPRMRDAQLGLGFNDDVGGDFGSFKGIDVTDSPTFIPTKRQQEIHEQTNTSNRNTSLGFIVTKGIPPPPPPPQPKFQTLPKQDKDVVIKGGGGKKKPEIISISSSSDGSRPKSSGVEQVILGEIVRSTDLRLAPSLGEAMTEALRPRARKLVPLSIPGSSGSSGLAYRLLGLPRRVSQGMSIIPEEINQEQSVISIESVIFNH